MFHAQQQQQQPWTLSFRAKAKNLDFKLRASRILPVSKLFQFSFCFKIHPYLFEIKSNPRSPFFSWKPKSLWFKFLHMFTNLHGTHSNHKCVFRSWCPHKLRGRRKGRIWLWRFATVVSCFVVIIMVLSNHLSKRFFLWKLFLRALNYNNNNNSAPAPWAYFYQFAVVILNEIRQSLGF